LGFLEKNRDTLSDSVVDMFKHSQDDLIRLLFHGNPSDGTSSLNKGVMNNKSVCFEIKFILSFSFNIEQQQKKMLEID
jgi:myosin heavy subunit